MRSDAKIRRGPMHAEIQRAEAAGVRDITALVTAMLDAAASVWRPADDMTDAEVADLERAILRRIRAKVSPAKARDVAAKVTGRAMALARARAEKMLAKARADRRADAKPKASEVIARIRLRREKQLGLLLSGDVQRDIARRAAESATEIDFGEAVDIVLRRARLIGETETYSGISEASREAIVAQLVGDPRGIWRTQQDDRVRPEHEEREGQVFDLREGIDGELPGEPPNCRCWFDPVLPEDDA